MKGVNELNELILVEEEEVKFIVDKKVGSKDNKRDQKNGLERVTGLHIILGSLLFILILRLDSKKQILLAVSLKEGDTLAHTRLTRQK
jgi:hypothetical protein